jgi:hypothetical protein
MLAHLTSTTPPRPSTRAEDTTPPFRQTAPLGRRSRDSIAGHIYARPTVRELSRQLDATFDPRTW